MKDKLVSALIVGFMLALLCAAPTSAAPRAVHFSAPAMAQTACHLTLNKVTGTFRYADGSRSVSSDWQIEDTADIGYIGNEIVKGTVRSDNFVFQENGQIFAFEGAIFQSTVGSEFIVTCVPRPGTSHTSVPPRNCPLWPSDPSNQMTKQFGGHPRNWYTPSGGPHYFFWAQYQRNQLTFKPARHKLGSFTVPFQSRVTDLNTGVQYTPGYRVPQSNYLEIDCFPYAES